MVIQWELLLATQYTLEDLSRFTLADIVLPRVYFEEWLNKLLQLPTHH